MSDYPSVSNELVIDLNKQKRHGTIIPLESICVLLNLELPSEEHERRFVLKRFSDGVLKSTWLDTANNLQCLIHQCEHILLWRVNEPVPLSHRATPDHIIHLATRTDPSLKSQMSQAIESAKRLLEKNQLQFPQDFQMEYGNSFFNTQTEEVVQAFIDRPFYQSPLARFQGDPFGPYPEDTTKTYLEAFRDRLHEVTYQLGYEPDPECGILKCPDHDELLQFEDVYAGFRRFSEYFEDPARQQNVPTLNIQTMKLERSTTGWRQIRTTLSGRVALAFTLGMVPFRGASLSGAIKAVRDAITKIVSYRSMEKAGLVLEPNTMRGLILRQLEGAINSLNLGNPNVLMSRLSRALTEDEEVLTQEPEETTEVDGEADEPLIAALFDEGLVEALRQEQAEEIQQEDSQETEPISELPEVSEPEVSEVSSVPVLNIAKPQISVRKRLRELGTTEDVATDLMLAQYSFAIRDLVSFESRQRVA